MSSLAAKPDVFMQHMGNLEVDLELVDRSIGFGLLAVRLGDYVKEKWKMNLNQIGKSNIKGTICFFVVLEERDPQAASAPSM